jgi:hypothetical protein
MRRIEAQNNLKVTLVAVFFIAVFVFTIYLVFLSEPVLQHGDVGGYKLWRQTGLIAM